MAYIYRTLAANNQKKLTISAWVKLAKIQEQGIINNYYSGSYWAQLYFNSSGHLIFADYRTSYILQLQSTESFKDVGSWYHVVANFDCSIGSPTAKLYVNGSEVKYSSQTIYSQNATTSWNTDYIFNVGRGTNLGGNDFDGVMSDVYFIQGYTYDASTFGETDATTGEWKPITSPTINYGGTGGNSCHLKFENSANMDLDSGSNNISFTTSGTLTQTKDNPSNNFATFNSLTSNNPTLSGANLIATASGGYRYALSTIAPTTGKYYAEFKLTTDSGYTNFGVENLSKGGFSTQYNSNSYIGEYNSGVAYQPGSSSLYHNGSSSGSYGGAANGDVIGIAMDLDNGFIYWSKNGTFLNSGVPTSAGTGTGGYAISNIANTTGTNNYAMGVSLANTGGGRSISANFGNGYFGTTAISSAGSNASNVGLFEYDVPAGYTALSTTGLNK